MPQIDNSQFEKPTIVMSFGKHKGKKIHKVPASYLLWCLEQDWFIEKFEDLAEYVEEHREELEAKAKTEKRGKW